MSAAGARQVLIDGSTARPARFAGVGSEIVRWVGGGYLRLAGWKVCGDFPALDKVVLVAAFGPAVIAKGPKAGAFIGGVAKVCGGGGGGRPNLAQAGGRDGAALDGALEQASQELKNTLLAG